MLEAALVAGICAEGANVVHVGVLPTPGVAFVAPERGVPGAVVSASHNPFADNGIKLLSARGRSSQTRGSRIEQEIGRSSPCRRARRAAGAGPSGVATDPEGVDDYVAYLARS